MTAGMESLLLLQQALQSCLSIADQLGLDFVSPHIDLALARVDQIIEDAPPVFDAIENTESGAPSEMTSNTSDASASK